MKKLVYNFMFLTISLLIVSCHSYNTKFHMEVDKYLSEIGFEANRQNDTIVIIPLEGCRSCVLQAINDLSRLSSRNLNIVFIGESLPDFVKIPSNCNTFIDSTYRIRKYETNIFQPVFIIYQDEKVSIEYY